MSWKSKEHRLPSPNQPTRKNSLLLVVAAVLLVLAAPMVGQLGWTSGPWRHAVEEIIASLLCLMAGGLILIRHAGYGEDPKKIIGMGLLGAGFLDALHSIQSSPIFTSSITDNLSNLVPWTGLVPRLVLAAAILTGLSAQKRLEIMGPKDRIMLRSVYIAVLSLFVLLAGFMLFTPMPRAHYMSQPIHRPADGIVGLMFLACLIRCWRHGNWRRDPFYNYLMWSLLFFTAAQLIYIPFSGALFDPWYDSAHFLIVFGCAVIAAYGFSAPSAAELRRTKRTLPRFQPGFSAKVTLVNTLLVLFAGGITLGISFQEFTAAKKEALQQRQRFELTVKTSFLAEQLAEMQRDMLFLAGVPPIGGMVRSRRNGGIDDLDGSTEMVWRHRLVQLFKQTALINPDYLSLRFVDMNHDVRELIRVEHHAGPPFVALPRPVSQAEQTELANVVAHLSQGRVYFSNPALPRDDEGEILTPPEPVIQAVTPVYDGEGRCFGVIILSRRLSPTFSNLKQLVQKNNKLYITDHRGELLYSSENTPTFAFEFGRSNNLKRLIPETRTFFEAAPAESSLFSSITENREAVLIQTVQLDPDGRFLACVLSTQMDRMLSISLEGRNTLLGSGLLILLIALIIGWLTANSLTRPLRYIADTISRYGEDQNQHDLLDLPVMASDEIGVLARAFDKMSRKVRERTLLLEHEIKERREAEKSIQAGERYLRTIMDQMADGLIIMGVNRRILSINPAVTRIFGYEAEEVIGQNVNILMPSPVREEHDDYLKNYFKTGVKRIIGQPREVTGLTKDGVEIPVLLAVSEALVQNGHIFIGTIQDLTEQKRIRNDLIAARHLAEAASRAKSEFLATMSHEIRTPMNGIIGMAELLMRSNQDNNQREFTEILLNSADLLLTLLNDILDFSKVESGGMTLEHLPFQLDGFMEELVDLSGRNAQEKGLHLSCFLDPSVPTGLMGDEIRLRQILLNLINNAIKFTGKGSIRIGVELAGGEADRPHLRFSVEDTGIGIAEDQLEAIFRPFTQADSSTTRKFGGTGLGLAICRRLTELMGGEISLTSTPNQGSTFTVTLPFEKSKESLNILDPKVIQAGLNRLMLIGGHPHDREIIEAYVTHWGLEFQYRHHIEDLVESGDDPAEVILLGPEVAVSEVFHHTKDLDPRPILIPVRNPLPEGSATLTNLGLPLKPSRLFRCLTDPPAQPVQGTDPTGGRDLVKPHQKILIVEDNQTGSRVVGIMLETSGYEIEIAENGREALKLLREKRVDLVLMDCDMPVMDGATATRIIRNTPGHETLPIIAMTANVLQSNKDHCREAGMNDFLGKPLKMDEVLEKVRLWTGAGVSTST